MESGTWNRNDKVISFEQRIKYKRVLFSKLDQADASFFFPRQKKIIANSNPAFSENPVYINNIISYKRWGGFDTERFFFFLRRPVDTDIGQQIARRNACMPVRDKLQTPSNAEMVVSLSVG